MLRKLKVYFMLLRCRLLIKFKLDTIGNIYYIGGADSLPPPLAREEEIILMSKFHQNSAEVRSILIEHNLRLVVYIAKKFENTNVNVEDLISIGTIGLINDNSNWEQTATLNEAMKKLEQRERQIIQMRFYDGKTQMEVAAEIGISQAQVSRLEKNALKHMRKNV